MTCSIKIIPYRYLILQMIHRHRSRKISLEPFYKAHVQTLIWPLSPNRRAQIRSQIRQSSRRTFRKSNLQNAHKWWWTPFNSSRVINSNNTIEIFKELSEETSFKIIRILRPRREGQTHLLPSLLKIVDRACLSRMTQLSSGLPTILWASLIKWVPRCKIRLALQTRLKIYTLLTLEANIRKTEVCPNNASIF